MYSFTTVDGNLGSVSSRNHSHSLPAHSIADLADQWSSCQNWSPNQERLCLWISSCSRLYTDSQTQCWLLLNFIATIDLPCDAHNADRQIICQVHLHSTMALSLHRTLIKCETPPILIQWKKPHMHCTGYKTGLADSISHAGRIIHDR